jgi:hypothetical protein
MTPCIALFQYSASYLNRDGQQFSEYFKTIAAAVVQNPGMQLKDAKF